MPEGRKPIQYKAGAYREAFGSLAARELVMGVMAHPHQTEVVELAGGRRYVMRTGNPSGNRQRGRLLVCEVEDDSTRRVSIVLPIPPTIAVEGCQPSAVLDEILSAFGLRITINGRSGLLFWREEVGPFPGRLPMPNELVRIVDKPESGEFLLEFDFRGDPRTRRGFIAVAFAIDPVALRDACRNRP